MEQTVYADLLFMINFSMDFLCLFLVAKLLTRHLSLPRAALASALGGFYAIVSLFIPRNNLWGMAIDILICLLMCVITFAGRHERCPSIILITAAYFLASMLLGGIMTAIFNLLNRTAPSLDALSDGHDMPMWLFAAVASLSSLITWIGGKFLRSRSQIIGADIEVHLGNQKAVMRALCDSGNLLRDSVSGKPVIVSDMRHAAKLLPAGCLPVSRWNTDTVTSLPPSVVTRIRVIPVETAASERMMYALRPDSIIIRVGEKTRTADALIGFADIRRTPSDCTAIIPPELVT